MAYYLFTSKSNCHFQCSRELCVDGVADHDLFRVLMDPKAPWISREHPLEAEGMPYDFISDIYISLSMDSLISSPM